MAAHDGQASKLPPSNRNDFYETLKFEVSELAVELKGDYDSDDIFVIWVLKELFDLEEALYMEALEAGGPRDCGVDAFWEFDGTVNILQSKFWKPQHSVNEKEIDNFLNVVDYLRTPAKVIRKRCKSYILERAEDFKDYVERGDDVRLVFVTSSTLEPAAEKKWEVSVAQRNDLSFELLTIDDIYARWKSKRDKKSVDVKVLIDQNQIFQRSGEPRALVFTLKASALRAWKRQFGDAVLGENIRYYLGSTGPVNRGMRSTLEDSSDRGNFWYYNNGITMVCRDFSLDKTASILEIKDLQIVNGAQTTETVNRYFREHGPDGDFDLLARLIKSAKSTFLDRVRLYNNRQNPTQPRDFASHRDRQVELQKEFRAIGYFYEIRRGELATLPTHERKAFKGITDNLTVAQAHFAFMGHPAEAKSNKKALLDVNSADGPYGQIFKEGTTARELLLSYLCLAHAGKRFSEAKKAQRQGDTRVGEYLLHGTMQIVATMGVILRTKGVLDLKSHLSDPSRYSKLTSAALVSHVYDLAEEIVGELYGTALGFYEQEGKPLQASRFFKNVSSASKMLELAESRVRSKRAELKSELSKILQ